MFRTPLPRLNAVVATIEPTKAPTTGIGITVCPIAAPIAAPVASIALVRVHFLYGVNLSKKMKGLFPLGVEVIMKAMKQKKSHD